MTNFAITEGSLLSQQVKLPRQPVPNLPKHRRRAFVLPQQTRTKPLSPLLTERRQPLELVDRPETQRPWKLLPSRLPAPQKEHAQQQTLHLEQPLKRPLDGVLASEEDQCDRTSRLVLLVGREPTASVAEFVERPP